jgi:hypothetical protein
VRPASATLAALALLACALAACAPTRHRVAPFRDDAALARSLEERAVAYCRAVQPDGTAPPRPFRTDGCTCWWNDDWTDCCVDHDMRYWCGGPSELRGATDADLRRCVGANHSKVVAFLMYLGTRLFAASWVPAHWRWGYGWRWPRSGPDSAPEADSRQVPTDEGATMERPPTASASAVCVSRAGPLVGRTPSGSGGGSPPRAAGSRPG